MAGDWIKVRTTLKDDPRVMAMADMLGVDDAHMVGVLVTFWSWADSHTEDGLVRNLSASRADKIGTLSGFASALESVGWAKIDSESGTIELINFAEHNGNTAKRRASEAKRKASNRNILNESRNVSASNADKSRTKTGQDAELEKRRIEKSITERVDMRKGAPTESDCEKFAISSAPSEHAEFAASVGREFHALYAGQNWRQQTGADLLPNKWKYTLKMRVESELRNEIAKSKRYTDTAAKNHQGRSGQGNSKAGSDGSESPRRATEGINVKSL